MSKQPNTKSFYNATIPEDWEVKELDTLIISISNGVTYDPDSKEGFPITRIETIAEGKINKDKVGLTPYLDSLEKYKLKRGEILYSHINSVAHIGKTAYCEQDYEILHGMNLLKLKPKSTIDSVFLFYILNSKFGRRQAYSAAKRAVNQASLSSTEIKHFKFPVPPLPEQHAIARLLSTWDEAIAKTQELIAPKELRKKWLMQQLLFGKKRLNGFNGEWKRLGAGEIFKSVSIKGFNNEELLSATQDKGIIPRSLLDAKVTMPSGETTSFKLVERGDFVISLRSFQGGLEYSYYRGIVSPAYTVLKPKKKINDEFYKQYFKSYDFISHLAIAVIGIRDGKQISFEDFCFVNIPYPSIEEQTAIAQVLQTAEKEIQMLKAKAEKLKEQKKGLMQVLLTGKIRLKI